MTKLGISYNLFDGEENLPASFDTVKHIADFVCVVYQETSNTGEKRDMRPVLELCRKVGIKHHILFRPVHLVPAVSEAAKRNVGLDISRSVGCTHYMTMDCDELYKPDEIARVWEDVRRDRLITTACQMLTYYKKPTICVDPPEEYFVPLIYQIDSRRFGRAQNFPVQVDKTRKLETLPTDRFRVYGRNEIEMHHWSYIRDDIRMKLRNSSAVVNFSDRVEEIAQYFDNYVDGEPAYFGGSEIRKLPVRVIQ